MNVKNTYYQKLVEGYFNKTLTKRELTIFFDLLSKGELDFYLEEDMVLQSKELEFKPKHSLKRSIIFASAAIVIILLGLFWYQYKSKPLVNKSELLLAQPVIPGREQAILTLSDGQAISLENNETINNDNSELAILKKGNGSIGYDISKYDLTELETAQLKGKFHKIETPKGGTYRVILPDQSIVWLNSNSSISFPIIFDEKERLVEIEGEAFFEISKNKKKPFNVKMERQQVKVLGTKFNVNAYKDEPFIRTSLFEGRIELITKNKTIELSPGEEAIQVDHNIKIGFADIGQITAWKDGYFRFDKTDIPTLMRQISRWYDVTIEYQGDIPKEKFVGKIPRSEKIENIIEIFKSGGMKVSLKGRKIIVGK